MTIITEAHLSRIDLLIESLARTLDQYPDNDFSCLQCRILLTELKTEKLRALSSWTKTHALLAELQMLVETRQLKEDLGYLTQFAKKKDKKKTVPKRNDKQDFLHILDKQSTKVKKPSIASSNSSKKVVAKTVVTCPEKNTSSNERETKTNQKHANRVEKPNNRSCKQVNSKLVKQDSLQRSAPSNDKNDDKKRINLKQVPDKTHYPVNEKTPTAKNPDTNAANITHYKYIGINEFNDCITEVKDTTKRSILCSIFPKPETMSRIKEHIKSNVLNEGLPASKFNLRILQRELLADKCNNRITYNELAGDEQGACVASNPGIPQGASTPIRSNINFNDTTLLLDENEDIDNTKLEGHLIKNKVDSEPIFPPVLRAFFNNKDFENSSDSGVEVKNEYSNGNFEASDMSHGSLSDDCNYMNYIKKEVINMKLQNIL